jgi:cytochrome c-type biogenesis protein CcmH
MRFFASFLCAALLALASSARADTVAPTQPVDPDRFYQLTSELRCPVCQNETLGDSTAMVAMDIKAEVHDRMAAGATDAEIKKFLVDRYGNFIIYRPPVERNTLLLWLGPLLLLAIGLLVVWRNMRANKAAAALEENQSADDTEKESAP